MIVLDEAYIEFADSNNNLGKSLTNITRAPELENLVVLRTFSKWAGLAGLRVGYGLMPPEIAAWLHRIKVPYNINVAALIAVRESLLDLDFLMQQVRLIVSERERLFSELRKLGWLLPYPSAANFILCLLNMGNAKEVQQKLQDKGILVRYFDKPRLENCIRISVGTPEDSEAVLKALREIGNTLA
jgi:histidinol-phosphate aminotransferase